MSMLRRLHLRLLVARDDRGATLVEYSLLVAFIALACFAAVGALGAENGASLDNSSKSIVTAN